MATPQQLDGRRIECAPDEVLLVANTHNEMLRLPYFLEYYRSLGVHHFLINDNASDDGSVDYLLAQPDVHTFSSPGSFNEARRGLDWLEFLRSHHAMDRWVVTADLDELFVYPLCEHVPLNELGAILDNEGARAVFAFLLDCYGDGPIDDDDYTMGEPFSEAHPFFDSAGYRAASGSSFPPLAIFGGPRFRLLESQGRSGRGPVLRKIPFVRWGSDVQYTAVNHDTTRTPIGSITGVMLHFKFLGPFDDKTKNALAREEFSAPTLTDYTWLQRQMVDGLNLMDEASVRYEDSLQLLDLGYIRVGKYGRIALHDAAKASRSLTRSERASVFTRMKSAEPDGLDDLSVPLGKALRLWPAMFNQT